MRINSTAFAMIAGASLAFLFGLISCGSGGGGSAPVQYTVIPQNAAGIIGASVVDVADTYATEGPAGTYKFPAGYVPTAPIMVLSKNPVIRYNGNGSMKTDTTGVATFENCLDEYANVSVAGKPITVCNVSDIYTYQDMDGSATWTDGDIVYNAGLQVNYIGSTTIYITPVSALIPSTGVPTNGFAGFTKTQLDAVVAGGDANADSYVQIAAAKITALQETLVKVGADSYSSSLVIASLQDKYTKGGITVDLARSFAAGVNLMMSATDLYSVSITLLITNPNVVAGITLANIYSAAKPVAKSLDLLLIPGDPYVAEAAVTLVQTNTYTSNLPVLQTLTDLGLNKSSLSAQSNIITAAQILQKNGLATTINALTMMHIYDSATKRKWKFDLNTGQASAVADVYTDNIVGFKLTYNGNVNPAQILIAAPGSPVFDGYTLTFDQTNQIYAYSSKNTADPYGLAIWLSLSYNASGVVGKIITYCKDKSSGQCAASNIFVLTTQTQTCGLKFTDGYAFAYQATVYAATPLDKYAGISGYWNTFVPLNANVVDGYTYCP